MHQQTDKASLLLTLLEISRTDPNLLRYHVAFTNTSRLCLNMYQFSYKPHARPRKQTISAISYYKFYSSLCAIPNNNNNDNHRKFLEAVEGHNHLFGC